MLGKEKDKTSYGKSEVVKALGYGAVDTLLLSRKLDKETIREFEKLAEKSSTKVEIVSTDINEGEQFWNLSGIGAILRFKIS
jgi:stalled ribosome rescue protein Dom34